MVLLIKNGQGNFSFVDFSKFSLLKTVRFRSKMLIIPRAHRNQIEYCWGFYNNRKCICKCPGVRKAFGLTVNNSWILHHDNTPSHNDIVIRKHLAKNKTNTIQQPPNSPDLAPCEFFLFGRFKKPLCATRYSIRDDVMEKLKMALMAIQQTDYKKCFEDWIKRWHKCVAVDGEYFEGDNIDYDE